MIGVGAMIAIGEKAAELGANALRSLTAGIRDGWGEYNALTNSTQTILVNTERWGSTMEDVSSALEELNTYADLTTYAFSDMTRNIGYFTTAGVQNLFLCAQHLYPVQENNKHRHILQRW